MKARTGPRSTIRDQFAGIVLTELCRNHPANPNDHWNIIAMSCYAAADAMMKERLRRARERKGVSS